MSRSNNPIAKPHQSDILLAAARGNLEIYREGKHHQFRMNGKKTHRNSVLELMRMGLLEADRGKKYLVGFYPVQITPKGREALSEYLAKTRR